MNLSTSKNHIAVAACIALIGTASYYVYVTKRSSVNTPSSPDETASRGSSSDSGTSVTSSSGGSTTSSSGGGSTTSSSGGGSTTSSSSSISSSGFPSHDVFLSYAWGPKDPATGLYPLQEKVKVFRKAIKEAGYECWLDIEQMPTSATANDADIDIAMADGLRQASVVVVCLSNAYVCSLNCRKELTFAKNLNKTILYIILDTYNPSANNPEEDWLTIKMGSALRFDAQQELSGAFFLALKEAIPSKTPLKESVMAKLLSFMRSNNLSNPPVLSPPRPLPTLFDPRAAFEQSYASNIMFVNDNSCNCLNYEPLPGPLGKWLVFGGNPRETPKDMEVMWEKVKAKVEESYFPTDTPIFFAKVARKDPKNKCLMVFTREGDTKREAKEWLVKECGVPEAEVRWKAEQDTHNGIYSRDDPVGRGGQ